MTANGANGTAKTATNGAKRRGVPFAKGHDPRRGAGLPGRSGRKPDEFRESLRTLLDDPKISAAVKSVLKDKNHPQFARLYATVVAQAHGNPTQPISVDPAELPVFRVEGE